MEEMRTDLDDADIVVEYLKESAILEVRILGELRKAIRKVRSADPIPEKFSLSIDGQDYEITRDMFNINTGWKTRIDLEKAPSSILIDLDGFTHTRIIPEEPKAYIYWNKSTGDIVSISPCEIESPTDNPPMICDLSEVEGLFSGELALNNYQVTFSKEDLTTPLLSKKVALTRANYNSRGMVYRILFNPVDKTIEVHFYSARPEETVLYVTKPGDPTYLIEKLEFPARTTERFIHGLNTKMKEISIYTQMDDGEFIPVAYEKVQPKALYEVLPNTEDPDIVVEWRGASKELNIKLLNEESITDGCIQGHNKIGFYITKRGDACFLVQELWVNIFDLMNSPDKSINARLGVSDVDVSVFTRPLFDRYNLVRE